MAAVAAVARVAAVAAVARVAGWVPPAVVDSGAVVSQQALEILATSVDFLAAVPQQVQMVKEAIFFVLVPHGNIAPLPHATSPPVGRNCRRTPRSHDLPFSHISCIFET